MTDRPRGWQVRAYTGSGRIQCMGWKKGRREVIMCGGSRRVVRKQKAPDVHRLFTVSTWWYITCRPSSRSASAGDKTVRRFRGQESGGDRKAGQGGQESGTGTILTRWGVLDYGSAMPRTARVAPGGMVFHVLNRGVARMQLFEKATDYQAFEQVLQDTLDQSPMRICAYAVMPNLWHLLLWPECDGELAAFMQRLTITLCVAGKNTGLCGIWAMSTKVDTSRSQWKATSISGLWPDTFGATRWAPISSCERRNGGGQACGNAVILREQSGRCWRRGRSICQRIGSSGSIKPTTRRNWKASRSVQRGRPLASRNGSRKSRNVWA